jgi:hypothetical protein
MVEEGGLRTAERGSNSTVLFSVWAVTNDTFYPEHGWMQAQWLCPLKSCHRAHLCRQGDTQEGTSTQKVRLCRIGRYV